MNKNGWLTETSIFLDHIYLNYAPLVWKLVHSCEEIPWWQRKGHWYILETRKV